MNPIFKSHEKDFMRIEADQVCVDYNEQLLFMMQV